MPNLRCPSCYYATTVRQDSVDGVKCAKCGNNLFDFYYKGKSASEAASLIVEKGTEFKKKKAKADRDNRKRNSVENSNENSNKYLRYLETTVKNKESLTESVLTYAIAGALILAFFGGFQYFQMRSGVQESTIKMLNENGYGGYEADGITLPIAAAFGGINTAKVFLKDNSGDTKIIEVEVIQKGVPILSLFVGSEYYTEISGIEVMNLN